MKLRHKLFSSCSPNILARIISCRATCQPTTRSLFGVPDLSSLSPFGSSGGGKGGDEQTYHERKILPYTRKQLYELVADVDNYHRFVPYCVESKVLSTRSVVATAADGDLELEKKEARLTVGFLGFKESYVSKVTCRPYESVEALASSTPLFNKLETTWRFQPANPLSPHSSQPRRSMSLHAGSEGPTLLSIDLTFAFSNPLYGGVSSAFFKQVSAMMVQAFEERCVQVYGKGGQ